VKPKKQKAKTSPATMPSTPEVGAPSKSSPLTEHLKEKDVIEIDEEPETVGGTDQGANTDMPSIDDEKINYLAEAPAADDAFQRNEVARGTPSSHSHMFPTLRDAPLPQRYQAMTMMMNEVWGNTENENEELDGFTDAFTTFFTKHKNVCQVIDSTNPQALS
jgi:hypothetical protein